MLTFDLRMNDQQKTKIATDFKEVHFRTLDDLVNINFLFTVAVFIGLSFGSPGQLSLDTREECQAGEGLRKMLIVYEVLAFSCFLLSSLVAKVIKLHLTLDGKNYHFVRTKFDTKDFLLILTAGASVAGVILLTLSVVNIVQIRIGLFSCGTAESRQTVWALCSIVAIALVIYAVSKAIAIFASFKTDALSASDSSHHFDHQESF